MLLKANTAWLQYPLIATVRNLFFHPLAKFPGPKLWAASRVPYVVSLLRGNLVHDQQEIHKKYGPVVRMAPDEISFTKEEAWRDIYVHRAGHQDLAKDPVWYKGHLPPALPLTLLLISRVNSTG